MEKSKLINGFIAKLKLAYPLYFRDLSNEEIIGLSVIFQEELSIFNELTLKNAYKSIIENYKYMPSIKEIMDECKKNVTHLRHKTIELMIDDGYFKDNKEIDKIYMWLEEGILPDWFKKDMKQYETQLLGNDKQSLMIEG